ncbi:MAG: SUMF1/EgtB/PvdO family nonheme iron enzyme [Labilithrix sp.]|nr:SUMF1/EgtB/PvdO family nonheme iron enzyme [Labilithrix sp.]
MSRGRLALVLALAAGMPLPIALAQKGGGAGVATDDTPGKGAAATEPPPVGAATEKEPPTPGASATAATPDLEGDEPDHASTPPPKEKPAPFVKQPTVLKDGMLRIPGGRFTMGSSDKKAPPNERPARAATTPPFWIDKTEVTVGAYRACVERGGCARPPRTSGACTYDMGDPQLPVSCVPWTSANAFCLAVGKRLPREIEWELAARGTTPIRYPWGGAGTACGMAATLAADNSARSCSGKKPARAGAHANGASPYGVLDMSGNVEEWVADWYADSVSELSPRAGASHVLRGGGWLSIPSLAKTTSRNWGSVREAGPNVGFRCARDD